MQRKPKVNKFKNLDVSWLNAKEQMKLEPQVAVLLYQKEVTQWKFPNAMKLLFMVTSTCIKVS